MKNNNKKYREKSIRELDIILKDLNVELIKSKGMMGTAKLNKEKEKKHTGSLTKKIRKEIARVETIIKEKQREGKK